MHVHFYCIGEFSVYDGMAFPEVQPVSLFKKIGSKVKEFFIGPGKEEEKMVVPSHEIIRESSLLVFLEDYMLKF